MHIQKHGGVPHAAPAFYLPSEEALGEDGNEAA
jgi:hypothetical protein